MSEKIIKFKKLDEKAIIPKYQTPDSAGFDFHAVVEEEYKWNDESGSVVILPGSQMIIKTGLV